jgi:hypothetical protein
MQGRYSVERFTQNKTIENEKFHPYVLDSNPLPIQVPLGIKGFPVGRILIKNNTMPNIPFSEKLREKEISVLNEKLKEFTVDREPKILWVCGQPGVGKTALLQYFFQKPLISSELTKNSGCWFITYDKHEEVQFLNNPSKYLLEQLNESLMSENITNNIFHEAIAGTIYKFLVSDKFSTFKNYLVSEFTDQDFNDLKIGIESKGNSYVKKLLDYSEDSDIDKIIKLLEVIRNSQVLDVDSDYFNGFIKPFIQTKLNNEFLMEPRIKSLLNPKAKAKQETTLVNTVKFLTSGAFDHFIIIIDQIDIAWNRSKTAYKRKSDFFDSLSSLIRQLNNSGLILIFAVVDEAAEELSRYINKGNIEARRIAKETNYLTVSEIKDIEEVKILLKEYLNKNKYRQEHLKELEEKEQKYIVNEGLFPFDDTGCLELLKKSAKTTEDILCKAAECLNICADKLEENPNDEKYLLITGKIVKDIL